MNAWLDRPIATSSESQWTKRVTLRMTAIWRASMYDKVYERQRSD